ncbi:hypothetical protein ACQ4PT_057755 [Festuca glaucescens]
MASRGGYDGGFTAGGKIRRRPASRAASASPYAPPAAATVPAARGGEGSGWLTRLITGSASRLLSSVFRKPPPQLSAPPLPEPFNAQPTRLESLGALPSQPELLDAPHSPPPPLEDDIPEGEENGGQTAKNLYTDNPENSIKDRDGMLRSSDSHCGIELEELLKQTTFTRSEFEYLAGLLRSRTVGYNTLQAEVSNIKQTQSGKKENGSRGLPVNFSIRSYSVADQVASPAELAKAYMGSRCPEGSPLRLRLHDPSFLPNKPVEAITVDKSLNPPLFQSSRLSASTSFDHLGSNYMTPNKSAIHKMSSSPSRFLFLIYSFSLLLIAHGPVPSRDMSGTVSSSYQTSNSVHTFGRQEYSLLNNINVAAKLTPAAIDGKTVDAISDRSAVLESKSPSGTSPKDSLEVDNCSGSTVTLRQSNDKIEKSQPAIQEHTPKNSGTANKENPPAFSLQSYSPSNLVLSSENDRSLMSASSNGFSFAVMAALGAHSQAPPDAYYDISVYTAHGEAPIFCRTQCTSYFCRKNSKRVSGEGSVLNKHDKKLNGEVPPISSKSAGHVASFTSNPVFNVVNSKPTALSNGLAHTVKSTASAIFHSNGPNNSVFSTNAGSPTSSLPQFSFQPGFHTSSTSTQQSGGIQLKAAPDTTLPFSMQSSSTGDSFTFLNTGPSSSLTSSKIFAGTTSQSAGAPPSGSSNAPFSFSPKFGGASFVAAQDKSKTGSSSTPLNFSPQFGSVSSVASLDKPKVTSSESTMLPRNQCAQSGNSNSLSTQSSVSKWNLMSPEKSNMGSLPRFADSQFGSAPSSSSPFSSVVSLTAASGLTSE